MFLMKVTSSLEIAMLHEEGDDPAYCRMSAIVAFPPSLDLVIEKCSG
jgi:hypothetical protein